MNKSVEEGLKFFRFSFNLEKAFDYQFPIPDRRRWDKLMRESLKESMEIAVAHAEQEKDKEILTLQKELERLDKKLGITYSLMRLHGIELEHKQEVEE